MSRLRLALFLVIAIGGVATPTRAVPGPVAHLEAHARVIWVLERVDTGEIVWTRPGRIEVKALDTDTSSPACSIPDCSPSGDRIAASIDDGPQVDVGSFDGGARLPAGQSLLFLPGGVGLAFVDGGQPGTEVVDTIAGVARTRDFVRWLNTSPSFRLSGFLLSGNIRLRVPD